MTNREEVAKKLREAGKGNNDWSMGINAAFFKIGDIIGARYRSYEFFFNTLADLIDPTCHQVIEDETQVCSECSEDLDEGYGWDFCPHCGARVVNGVPNEEA